ncbi:MAG TPA: hypothetical protein VFJ16_16660 [Longimicrobium sp.]|nr:hypothetical protein [Longimicrobium sp.]
MRTLTLDPSDLQVETFAPRAAASLPGIRFAADTDDADCDTESGPPDCPTFEAAECETFDCTDPDVCGQQTEEC